jgi:hypothetical protein
VHAQAQASNTPTLEILPRHLMLIPLLPTLLLLLLLLLPCRQPGLLQQCSWPHP